MNKLNEQESLELYRLLKDLKQKNWTVDIRDIGLFFTIWDFHFKINNLISAYDGLDSMEQISYMVKDLCEYFKQDIPEIRKQKCTKCRRLLPIEEFFSKRQCDRCRNLGVRK
jgi:hypothetical protein